MWWEYNISETFIKMLPTNLSASIGLAQLKKIDKLQKEENIFGTIIKMHFLTWRVLNVRSKLIIKINILILLIA